MQKYVKKIGDERLTKCPADLDTKPYRDEHDMELLGRMSLAIEKGHAPEEFKSKKVRNAIKDAVNHVKERKRAHVTRTAKTEKLVKGIKPARRR